MSVIMWKVSVVLAWALFSKHSLKQKLCATSVLGNRIFESGWGVRDQGQGGSKGGRALPGGRCSIDPNAATVSIAILR